MPLYRCESCHRELDKPACADCDLDPAKDPRDGQYIVELVILHYDPPHAKVKGRGLGHAACDPRLKVGGGIFTGFGGNSQRFTGEKSVVNCPACKTSEAFLADTPPPEMPALPIGPLQGRAMAPVADEAPVKIPTTAVREAE